MKRWPILALCLLSLGCSATQTQPNVHEIFQPNVPDIFKIGSDVDPPQPDGAEQLEPVA